MNRKLLIIASVVAVLTALTVTPAYAAGIVVNTDTDKDGLFIFDGQCGLREAIANATNDAATFPDCSAGSGADTITFAANYTITLRNELAVTTAITITGNGAANTIIQANAAPNTATYRVLEVTGIGNLTLDSLTVRNGYCGGLCATNGALGGGIYNVGTLTVSNVTFSGNSALYGGGMANRSSPTLTNVTFSSNSATNYGGGMYNLGSSPTLTNVTFSANSASIGGGMNNASSSSTLTNVTFSGNSATSYGGGMYNLGSSPTLTNVTFSANSASIGGGMYNDTSFPSLMNVTFSGNSAGSLGGGMYNFVSSPTLTNVILWGDTATSGLEIYNLFSTPSISYSVGQGGCPAGSTCTAIINTNPLLGALQDNGGFTQTMALGTGSSAIDTGTNTGCPATDQRGVTRPQGAACDIGAYEVEADSTPPTVTPTNTPTGTPTDTPTATAIQPTATPTVTPTNTPTGTPTDTPTAAPTQPTATPTNAPRDTPTFTPTPIPFQSCTPGYWKQSQHFDSWVVTGYSPNQTLGSVFVVSYSFGLDNKTLLQALRFKGNLTTQGAAQILLRAAVAALLNSAHPDVDYPLTTAEVIAAVNAALASNDRIAMLTLADRLDGYNNALCPLALSGQPLPVYGPAA